MFSLETICERDKLKKVAINKLTEESKRIGENWDTNIMDDTN
jgi:hypothetical protein